MPPIHWNELNWIAILVSAVVTFVIGGVWYSALFAKPWQTAHGFDAETVKRAQAAMSPARFFGGMLGCYLMLAVGMAVLVQWTGVSSLAGGAGLGLLVGIALVVPVVLTNHLPSLVKPAGFLIDASYELLYCALIGAILGGWR